MTRKAEPMNRMQYTVVYVLVFFLLNAQAICAQSAAGKKMPGTKIPAWEITYALALEPLKTDTTAGAAADSLQLFALAMMEAMSSRKNNDPSLRGYVTTRKIRVETNGFSPSVELGDKTTGKAYVFTRNNKTAYQVQLARPKLLNLPPNDSLVVITADDCAINLLPDTCTIAGLHCKKAVVRVIPLPGEQLIQVWYAPELPALYWGEYNYLKKIPGCALAIQTESNGMLAGIKAATVKKIQVEAARFELPAGYSVTQGLF
jgi:GLPGLI family protein